LIADLEQFRVDSPDLPTETADRIWTVMDSMGVVVNTAKLVAGTKTLHHLLPDLVVPMDRGWTGRFFGMQTHEWQSKQPSAFGRVCSLMAELGRLENPEQYVTGEGSSALRHYPPDQ
jgi:hypothetical protein